MRDRIVKVAGVLALAGAVALATQGMAQVKKGKSRPMTTKQLMGGLVGPSTSALGKDLQGVGPADDKAWEAAATKAALLNESAHLMMDDGRCLAAAREHVRIQIHERTTHEKARSSNRHGHHLAGRQ